MNTLTLGNMNGKPIQWRELAREDRGVLLIAEEPVTARSFYGEKADIVWTDSPLRAWLNGEFLENAFTAEEAGRILAVENNTPDNPEFGAPGCGVTEDRIFLLSIDEAESLFADGEDRMAMKDGEPVYWWLRSPGFDHTAAAIVLNEGSVICGGNYVNDEAGWVRPALWLRSE